jgi:hypothetical protein
MKETCNSLYNKQLALRRYIMNSSFFLTLIQNVCGTAIIFIYDLRPFVNGFKKSCILQ